MSEHGEQVALFEWANMNLEHVPELYWLHAIPNGAKLPFKGRGKKRYSPEAMRLKNEGLKPGVPDVFLPIARQGYHGLYIEMKFGRNKPTKHQERWLAGLEANGYYTAVCWGMTAAKQEIIDYLGLREGTFIDML